MADSEVDPFLKQAFEAGVDTGVARERAAAAQNAAQAQAAPGAALRSPTIAIGDREWAGFVREHGREPSAGEALVLIQRIGATPGPGAMEPYGLTAKPR